MGLQEILATGEAQVDRKSIVDDAKALVLATFGDAVKAKSASCDVRVPYDVAQDVAAWIEEQGVRVAIQLQNPDQLAVLALSVGRAPPERGE